MSKEPEQSAYDRPADDDIEWVSRAEMKREAQRMNELAQQLVNLSDAQLLELALPDSVTQAVREARRLQNADARQRQTRHIGRLLQKLNTDLLRQRLALFDPDSTSFQQITQLAERWRDELLADPEALTRLLDQYPSADHQHLRQLLLNVLREAKKQTPDRPPSTALTRQRKKLFQALRDLITAHHPE